MSIRAVLAHEYYGHRTYKEEYNNDIEKGENTTPEWEDECRASITAAKITPGLTQMDRCHLVQDAFKRADEYGQWIKTDDFMKEVLYGYSENGKEKNIVPELQPLQFVSAKSKNRNVGNRRSKDDLSKMQGESRSNNNGYVR